MRTPGILNFGSLNIDWVYQVDHLVLPGETLSATSLRRHAGGKGANQSVALARAGAPVTHVGTIGPDGRWLVELLRTEGVDTSGIQECPEPSGHAIIQVDRHGQNSILLHPGANHRLDLPRIEKALDACDPGTHVLLQNETSAVAGILQEAGKRSLPVCFNPAPMNAEAARTSLRHVSTLVLNETEGAEMAGTSDPEQMAAKLTAQHPHLRVVLTLGARGVLSAAGPERLFLPALPVTAIDTTAAGDCFIGFYLAARLQGLPETSCLELAVQAASLCVTRAGAIHSIPHRKELADRNS